MKKYNLAFTLIELMITTSIIAVIMLSFYCTFSLGINTYQKTKGLSRLNYQARHFINILEKDLKNSIIYSKDNAGFAGNQKTITFFTISDSITKEAKLQPQVLRVSYYLKDSAIFRETQSLNDSLEFEGESCQALMPIREMNFSYAYVDNGRSDFIWKNFWRQDDIPQGISLNLYLEDNQTNQEISLRKVIFIAQGKLGA